ncbi:MAG TPA: hypothetical protein VGN15_00335 [Ktedonobacteraceae bacterium]|nr:hypothetical protein [Ktedonobacteraceae bacterium]
MYEISMVGDDGYKRVNMNISPTGRGRSIGDGHAKAAPTPACYVSIHHTNIGRLPLLSQFYP